MAIPTSRRPVPNAVLGSVLALYVVILAIATRFHESWFDEAQAWLLARDSSPFQLWFHFLRYEGTPGLWHSILMVPAKLGLPYESMHVVSCIAAAAAVALLLWRSPFPLIVRLLLPFTYFLMYQYAVVARSYTLFALPIFCAAALLPEARRRTYAFVAVLIILANVSLHGTLAASGILFAYFVSLWPERSSLTRTEVRRHALASVLFLLVLLILVVQLWPPKDHSFHFSAQRLTTRQNAGPLAAQLLMESLSDEGPQGEDARKDSERGTELIRQLPGFIASAFVLVLSVSGFLRAGTLLYFALPVAGILLLSGLVHGSRWHSGTIFLIWLFTMWVTASRQRRKSPVDFAWLVWVLVLAPQIYWSAKSIGYDIRNPYSGAEAVANYLKQTGLENRTIFAAGYAALSIEPYFAHNVFRNYGTPDAPAFWPWREPNTFPQMFTSIPAERPDVVIVVLHNKLQRETVQELLDSLPNAGYSLAREFPGHLYWKAYELEEESFLVIRKDTVGGQTARR